MAVEYFLPLFVPAFLGLVVVVILLVRRAESKRRQAMQQVAQELGLEFEPIGSVPPHAELGQMHLFTQGHSRRTLNVMSGRIEREQALLCDYRYVIGHGKNHTTHRQTVAAFSLGPHALPSFQLRPENIFHKIGAAFGYQDIDFADYPTFSSKYLVRGQDEAAVRDFFDGSVIEAVENARQICIEGSGRWLVVYRTRQLDVRKIGEFFEEARGLRAVFARRAAPRRA
jgi:hypothetical protein